MAVSDKVMAEVEQVAGTAEVDKSVEEGNPEIAVSVDRDKMARLGLSLEQVGAGMQTAFNGNTDAQFRGKDNDYDINIRLDQFNRKDVTDIGNLTFINNRGEVVRLTSLPILSNLPVLLSWSGRTGSPLLRLLRR